MSWVSSEKCRQCGIAYVPLSFSSTKKPAWQTKAGSPERKAKAGGKGMNQADEASAKAQRPKTPAPTGTQTEQPQDQRATGSSAISALEQFSEATQMLNLTQESQWATAALCNLKHQQTADKPLSSRIQQTEKQLISLQAKIVTIDKQQVELKERKAETLSKISETQTQLQVLLKQQITTITEGRDHEEIFPRQVPDAFFAQLRGIAGTSQELSSLLTSFNFVPAANAQENVDMSEPVDQ